MKRMCKDCEHYQQHYAFDRQELFRVCCGRCLLQRKKRFPDAAVCENFLLTPSVECRFVTKEYLTKELLQYLLQLELLPQMKDETKKE